MTSTVYTVSVSNVVTMSVTRSPPFQGTQKHATPSKEIMNAGATRLSV